MFLRSSVIGNYILSLFGSGMTPELLALQDEMRPTIGRKHRQGKRSTAPGGRRGLYNTKGAKRYRIKGLRP